MAVESEMASRHRVLTFANHAAPLRVVGGGRWRGSDLEGEDRVAGVRVDRAGVAGGDVCEGA